MNKDAKPAPPSEQRSALPLPLRALSGGSRWRRRRRRADPSGALLVVVLHELAIPLVPAPHPPWRHHGEHHQGDAHKHRCEASVGTVTQHPRQTEHTDEDRETPAPLGLVRSDSSPLLCNLDGRPGLQERTARIQTVLSLLGTSTSRRGVVPHEDQAHRAPAHHPPPGGLVLLLSAFQAWSKATSTVPPTWSAASLGRGCGSRAGCRRGGVTRPYPGRYGRVAPFPAVRCRCLSRPGRRPS